MKKIVLALFAIIYTTVALNAQVDGKAIGIRFNPIESDLTFQFPLSDINRLELDFGIKEDILTNNTHRQRLAIYGIYQWVWIYLPFRTDLTGIWVSEVLWVLI